MPREDATVTDEHTPEGPYRWCDRGCGRDLYEAYSWHETTCDACLQAEKEEHERRVRGWEEADRGGVPQDERVRGWEEADRGRRAE